MQLPEHKASEAFALLPTVGLDAIMKLLARIKTHRVD
jgi:hypothetical protein